jgi:hypothetical protein
MIDIIDFSKNFNGLTIPTELVMLLDFEKTMPSDEFYSAGFELTVDEAKHGLKTYSEDVVFLNSIMEFADADGMGSTYGFWLRNNNKNLAEAPIVIFGGEGGNHIVASNILELFQILTYDVEPMVGWDEVYYYKDEEDYEPSEQREAFKKWLFDNFKISETNNADSIVKAAQEKYQAAFKDWMKNYYVEE